MKILIVSDTHGYDKNLSYALEEAGEIDMLIHLGDLEGSEDYVEAVTECEKHMVRGNCDFQSSLPSCQEFFIGPYKVFITHGNFYHASMGTGPIREEGARRGADIVMFGHTHQPCLKFEGGVTLLNPGSLTLPRQEGRRASFLIMEIAEDGEAFYSQYEIDEKHSAVCVQKVKGEELRSQGIAEEKRIADMIEGVSAQKSSGGKKFLNFIKKRGR